MKSTDPLRPVNDELQSGGGDRHGNEPPAESGGFPLGEFPGDGCGPISLERWAEILGIDTKRCASLFRERNVPRKPIGKRMYARAADVWSAFPFVGESDG